MANCLKGMAKSILTMSEKRKFYIVWNEARNEGYVTDDYSDALYTQTGDQQTFYTPSLGDAMRECYDDEDLVLEEIEL